MMPGMSTTVPIVAMSSDLYIEHLREKKRRLDALCDAAKAYLAVELDREIECLAKPAEAPDMREFRYGPAPSIESLTRAVEAVQALESQIEKLDMIDGTPAAEYMGPLIDAMYRPMLQQQLDGAKRYRDDMQQRMEDAAKEQQL